MVKSTENSYIDFYNSNDLDDDNKTSQFGPLTTSVKYNKGLSRIPSERIGLTVSQCRPINLLYYF